MTGLYGEDTSDRLGVKFWALVFGVILAIGIGGMILFLLIGAAWSAFGFLGAMLIGLFAVAGGAWVAQRVSLRNR